MDIDWQLAEVEDQKLIEKLSEDLDIPLVIAKLLVLREIKDFEEALKFFQPDLSELFNPFLMLNMEKGVKLLIEALKKNYPICIYGDYDVDGTTGTAILYTAIRKIGGDVSFFIPDRFIDGYGLSVATIDKIVNDRNPKLIISVDCGITANEEISYAKLKYGVEFIVCDHHRPGDALPDSINLNPIIEGSGYPFANLAGCGVAFKFMQALYSKLDLPFSDLEDLLDLVAIGSTADIVPLVSENRILVKKGLQKINSTPSLGIKALINSINIKGEVEVSTIIYNIAPRINAVGRMGDAERAVRLLTSDNFKIAESFAQVMENENKKRKNLDDETFFEAINIAEKLIRENDPPSLVIYKAGWHLGVVGIIAARIVEKFYKPAILLSIENGIAKGSARSINGVNIFAAIQKNKDLLLSYGGHEYAAGLSLKEENLDEFVNLFNESIKESINNENNTKRINIDSIISFKELNPRFIRLIKLFSPFGPNNLRPVFKTENVRILSNITVIQNKHLMFNVANQGQEFNAIAFNMVNSLDNLYQLKDNLSLIYSVSEQVWKGIKSIQLRIKGFE